MAAGYHDFTAGEGLTAANLEDYTQNQSVMRFASAAAAATALSAVKTEGMVVFLLDVNSLAVYNAAAAALSTIGPVHGAFTSYTPVITQGATPTFTNGASTYTRVGRLITGKFICTITGTPGTAANAVLVTLPVAAATSDSLTYVGIGRIADSSASTHFPGLLCLASTTQVQFHRPLETGFTILGTSGFTAAVASGDNVVGNFQYEAAADA